MKIERLKILLVFFGILFIIIGALLIINNNLSELILKFGSWWKKKPVGMDWLEKLRMFGWQAVQMGVICFFWVPLSNYLKKFNKNKTIINPADELEFKKEYLKWTFTLFLSIVIFVTVAFIISALYHPDISSVRAKMAKLTILDPALANPKPAENLIFYLGILFFPSALFLLYLIFDKILKNIKAERITTLYKIIMPSSIILFIGIIVFGLIQSDSDHYQLNYQFYFIKSLPYNQFPIYALIIFPLITLLFIRQRKLNRTVLLMANIFMITEYCIILIILFSINIFFQILPNDVRLFNSYWSFAAVFYSMSQVAAGVPLLVNGFTNTYGLYPHFLEPIFRITGLSVYGFSVVMSILLCVSFGMLLAFLKKNIKNNIIVFLGFTSAVFLCYLFGKIVTWDYYFQYHPIRIVFPLLLLFLSGIYLEKRSRIIYYLCSLLSGFSILWNPDSGIVLFMSWFLFVSYLAFENREWKRRVLGILFHILNAAMSIVIAFGAYSIIIQLIYGVFPDLLKMFSTISVFSGFGFTMITTPLFHPWNMVVFVYLCGLIYAIRSLIIKSPGLTMKSGKNSNLSKPAVILFVSLIGIGSFAYYEGRSHNWNLVNVWIYFYILITFFADILLEKMKTVKDKAVKIWFGLILFMISFSFLDIIINYNELRDLIFKRNHLFINLNNDSVNKNTEFIKKYVSRGERILIIGKLYAGKYFSDTGTVSAFNPGFMELFLKEDFDRLIAVMTEQSPKIFVDRLSDAGDIIKSIAPVLNKYYFIKAQSEGITFYERRNH